MHFDELYFAMLIYSSFLTSSFVCSLVRLEVLYSVLHKISWGLDKAGITFRNGDPGNFCDLIPQRNDR